MSGNKIVNRILEEVGWTALALFVAIFVGGFILLICWFIIFPILGWLYQNGLSGIWEIIKNVAITIWSGAK